MFTKTGGSWHTIKGAINAIEGYVFLCENKPRWKKGPFSFEIVLELEIVAYNLVEHSAGDFLRFAKPETKRKIASGVDPIMLAKHALRMRSKNDTL